MQRSSQGCHKEFPEKGAKFPKKGARLLIHRSLHLVTIVHRRYFSTVGEGSALPERGV